MTLAEDVHQAINARQALSLSAPKLDTRSTAFEMRL